LPAGFQIDSKKEIPTPKGKKGSEKGQRLRDAEKNAEKRGRGGICQKGKERHGSSRRKKSRGV